MSAESGHPSFCSRCNDTVKRVETKMCFEYPEREYHRVFKRKGTAQKQYAFYADLCQIHSAYRHKKRQPSEYGRLP